MPKYNNRNNTYALNNSVSYNKSISGPTERIYLNNNPASLPNKQTQYKFAHLLTGGNTAGNVWVNNSYDIATEDPGISWTL